MMIDTPIHLDRDATALLDHGIDDLLLQARGIALVRDVLAERGASSADIAAHTRELERVRARLAGMIRGSDNGVEAMLLGDAA
jgi:hypothetical protein